MPKEKHLAFVCAFLFSTLSASPVRADLIVLNAAHYSLGTDLSAVSPGVTVSMVSQSGGSTTFNPVVSPVYSVVEYPVPIQSFGTTNRFFEYQACEAAATPSYSCTFGYRVLDFQFDAPTDYFQIDGYFYTDPNYLVAYDRLGNLIAGVGSAELTYTGGINGTTRGVLTLARQERDIARVVYGGDNSVAATQVTYNVPEPTTLILLGLGLVGVGFRQGRGRPSPR